MIMISGPNENSQKASISVSVNNDPDRVSNGKQAARKWFSNKVLGSAPLGLSGRSTGDLRLEVRRAEGAEEPPERNTSVVAVAPPRQTRQAPRTRFTATVESAEHGSEFHNNLSYAFDPFSNLHVDHYSNLHSLVNIETKLS